MRESNHGEAALLHAYTSPHPTFTHGYAQVVPFFSMRKLRLIYNELSIRNDFEFNDFDAFKHHVLSSVAPQLELGKWQAIASRR
ncbi:hypothetical protein ACFO4O_04930 [Glaciecola siphonariae]|uniref:Uncharacterized protein n=1 Tax=Glaciecola siphonariae TaxID=521012 RepID=A0ABV9LVN1_9ALTE